MDWTSNAGLACLSSAVAEPLAAYPWRQVATAATPDQEALLACLADEAKVTGT